MPGVASGSSARIPFVGHSVAIIVDAIANFRRRVAGRAVLELAIHARLDSPLAGAGPAGNSPKTFVHRAIAIIVHPVAKLSGSRSNLRIAVVAVRSATKIARVAIAVRIRAITGLASTVVTGAIRAGGPVRQRRESAAGHWVTLIGGAGVAIVTNYGSANTLAIAARVIGRAGAVIITRGAIVWSVLTLIGHAGIGRTRVVIVALGSGGTSFQLANIGTAVTVHQVTVITLLTTLDDPVAADRLVAAFVHRAIAIIVDAIADFSARTTRRALLGLSVDTARHCVLASTGATSDRA